MVELSKFIMEKIGMHKPKNMTQVKDIIAGMEQSIIDECTKEYIHSLVEYIESEHPDTLDIYIMLRKKMEAIKK